MIVRNHYRIAGALAIAAGVLLGVAHYSGVLWLAYVGLAVFIAALGVWAGGLV